MYCWSCGHKNPENNKFCGECGKIQVRPPVFVEGDMITDNVKTMNPPPRERRRASDAAPNKALQHGEARPSGSVPVVPPPGTGITPTQRLSGTNPLVEESRAVKDTPLSPPPIEEPVRPVRTSPPPPRISGPSFLGLSDAPSSADYLMEDEGESSSTWRSYVALGLVLLFGVLIYKQWDSVSAVGRDFAQRAFKPAENSTSPPPEAVASNSTPTEDAAANADDKPESDKVTPEEEKAAESAAAESPDATEADATKRETAPPEPNAEPAKPVKPESAAATATPAPVYDDSQVELAQKYLQGRGVAQDCNRGVSLLRSAAAQPNPKAQIKLGALYATGHCVSQDKAEAYRWFAEAHQLQPGNQWIDKNLNSLWSEMTAEERARVQR